MSESDTDNLIVKDSLMFYSDYLKNVLELHPNSIINLKHYPSLLKTANIY